MSKFVHVESASLKCSREEFIEAFWAPKMCSVYPVVISLDSYRGVRMGQEGLAILQYAYGCVKLGQKLKYTVALPMITYIPMYGIDVNVLDR
jgi:hypothetical protein